MSYRIEKSLIAGWVIVDGQDRIHGAYKTQRMAQADLAALQDGRLEAHVTDEGKGYLSLGPKARTIRS